MMPPITTPPAAAGEDSGTCGGEGGGGDGEGGEGGEGGKGGEGGNLSSTGAVVAMPAGYRKDGSTLGPYADPFHRVANRREVIIGRT